RMPRLPHRRPEPGAHEFLRWHLGALHVEDHRMPRPDAAREVAGEEHQQLIAEHDAALLVYGADAVAVAVERDAELGLLADDCGPQVAQVLEHGGIGMVIRKRAVRFAEQRHTSAPSWRSVSAATRLETPLPQSTPTLTGRGSGPLRW